MNLKNTDFLKSILFLLFSALLFSCVEEEIREVTLYDKPHTEATASRTDIKFGEIVDFKSTSYKHLTTTWTFAGGSPASSVNPDATVVYSNPGIYDAKLVIKYIDNTIETKLFKIIVKGIDPPLPYGGTAVTIPGTIEAENYNLGGEGIAYHDTEEQNLAVLNGSPRYRTDDGVDVQMGNNINNISYTQAGEWSNYTITVPATGIYDFEFRVASGDAAGGKSIKLQMVNPNTGVATDLGQTGNFPNTGSYNTYISKIVTGVNLTEGQNTFRVLFTGSNTNLDKINIKVSVPAPPIDGVGIFTEKDIVSSNPGIAPPPNGGNMAITIVTTNTNHGTKALWYHFDPAGNGSPQNGFALSHMDLTVSPYNATAYNNLNVAVKSSTPKKVRIRLNTNSGNYWVTLNPGNPAYGMLWDGQWHELVIPFSQILRDGNSAALSTVPAAKSSIKQFTIRTDDSDYSTVPNSFDYYIDDIYFTTN